MPAFIKLTKTKHNGRFRITSLLQLESRTVCPSLPRRAHRPALILLFAKKFFRGRLSGSELFEIRYAAKGRRYADTNEVERRIFWLLAYHPAPPTHLLPPSPPNAFGLALGSRIQLQQRNCSRLHGISRADPLFQARKNCCRLALAVADSSTNLAHGSAANRPCRLFHSLQSSTSAGMTRNCTETGALHSIQRAQSAPIFSLPAARLHRLQPHLALQEKFPETRLTVIDDFRPVILKIFAAIAEISSRRISPPWIGTNNSVTKIRCYFHWVDHRHDVARPIRAGARQRRGFSTAPEFRAAKQDSNRLRVIGVDLWPASAASVESNGAAPATLCIFQTIMDNVAMREAQEIQLGSSSVRYFNVYGPREAHKGVQRAWFITSRSR